MTLSKKQFNQQSIEFVRLCQHHGDTWYLLGQQDNGQFKLLPSQDSDGCERSHLELILSKTELRSCTGNAEVWSHEYNVIYNESYEVPVMYFSVSDQGGCPVALDKVVCLDSEDLSRAVSQVEHPLLFRPFYMIHPCRTEDFMRTHHEQNKSGYLISWLSVVATLIDLKLDLRLSSVCAT